MWGEVNIVRQVGSLRQEGAKRARLFFCEHQRRAGKLRSGGEFEIVGAVGDQPVAKGLEDLPVLKQESAGHALHVACRQTNKIAFEPGHQHAIDTFAVEVLAQLSVNQAEGVIEFAVGIGKTRQMVEVIRREKLGGAVFGTEVHKRDARTLGFELLAKFGELGDRLATEGSTKVAEKDQQERAVNGEGVDGFAGLRAVGLQKFRSDVFWSEHGRGEFE
jgi:hypothetical protein